MHEEDGVLVYGARHDTGFGYGNVLFDDSGGRFGDGICGLGNIGSGAWQDADDVVEQTEWFVLASMLLEVQPCDSVSHRKE